MFDGVHDDRDDAPPSARDPDRTLTAMLAAALFGTSCWLGVWWIARAVFG